MTCKFNHIAGLYSELVAVNIDGQLCQWRWDDQEPYITSQHEVWREEKSKYLKLYCVFEN